MILSSAGRCVGRALVGLVLVTGLGGCPERSPEPPERWDAAGIDARPIDASVVDGPTRDASVVDGSTRDASPSDAPTGDASAADAAMVDAAAIDASPALLRSIAVMPPSATLAPGDTLPLRAVGTFSDGSSADVTASATWSVLPAGPVSVSVAGVVTAVSPGGGVVTARIGTVAGTASIVVSAAALRSISIAPPSATVPAGITLPLRATGTYSDGSTRDVTASAAWTSSSAHATVSASGVVTGVTAGSATITATLDGVSGTAQIQVTAATLRTLSVAPANATTTVGLRTSYTATGSFSDGSSADVTAQVTWATGNANVATISNVTGANGQLLARNPGTTTVTATLGGISGQTLVTVVPPVLTSVQVTPVAPSVPVGTVVQFQAVALFSDGTQRNVTLMAAWSSSVNRVMNVSANGRGTALRVGTTTISATYQGVTGSANVTVTTAVLVQVQVTPFQPTLAVGTPLQMQATAIFSDGTSLAVTGQAAWSSSAPAIASVSNAIGSRGRVTALAPGQATISATYQGLTGATLVTVSAATVLQIQVTPFTPRLPVGFDLDMTATAIFSDGTTRNVTALAAWQSSAPGVAFVSNALGSKGQVSPIAAGTTSVSATYLGVTGATTVTVTAARLQTITVSPGSATVSVGGVQPFTALGGFDDGSTLDITLFCTWLSSNPSVADVSNAAGSRGQATGFRAGTVTITAQRGGITGAATLTVR